MAWRTRGGGINGVISPAPLDRGWRWEIARPVKGFSLSTVTRLDVKCGYAPYWCRSPSRGSQFNGSAGTKCCAIQPLTRNGNALAPLAGTGDKPGRYPRNAYSPPRPDMVFGADGSRFFVGAGARVTLRGMRVGELATAAGVPRTLAPGHFAPSNREIFLCRNDTVR